MSAPDDRDPHERETLPEIEPVNTEHPVQAIPAGFLMFEFSRALARLRAAMLEVESIGAAACRQLDEQSEATTL